MANPLNTTTINGVTYGSADYEAMQNSASRKPNDTLGKDAFLQLLVTQMQYQDPLDPQDNSEYLSQLAQFSALEQMTNVSDAVNKVNSLVENLDTSVLVGQLSSMIGQEIQWNTSDSTINDDGGVEYTSNTFVGKVTGVSISDGAPTIIAKATVDGKEMTYRVAVGDITRIGEAN